jgi:hypothetical protein
MSQTDAWLISPLLTSHINTSIQLLQLDCVRVIVSGCLLPTPGVYSISVATCQLRGSFLASHMISVDQDAFRCGFSETKLLTLPFAWNEPCRSLVILGERLFAGISVSPLSKKKKHVPLASISDNMQFVFWYLPGGAASMTAVIDGFSIELATLLFTATIAAYTLMGGLGAAFYVSYFNTGSIMILIVAFLIRIFFDNSRHSDNNPLGE